MKRLQPTSLTVTTTNAGRECKLRCRPKLDQIPEEEHAGLFITMKHRAINDPANPKDLEADFPFTFQEDNGAVLQDNVFFSLTGDDYGELWINKCVDGLTWAYDEGVNLPDAQGPKSKPHTIQVDESNTEATRNYKVIFSNASDAKQQEYLFTVKGAYDDRRNIAWKHGSYNASWKLKKWTFDSPERAEDLARLLIAIIRLDEAIHLELMAYANK